jgi:hypothetical protein
MSAPHSLQDAVKACLTAHPFVTAGLPIPIYTQDEGNLAAQIEAALGPAGVGIAIVVSVPSGRNLDPASQRVCLKQRLEIQVIELPFVNRAPGGANKTVWQTLRCLAAPWKSASQGLHGWWSGVDNCSPLRFIGFEAKHEPNYSRLAYGALFEFNETLV